MPEPDWRATWKVSKRWLKILGLVVIAPFGIVWGLSSSWNYAFDVLTGTTSAFHDGVGPAGEVLAVVGWLLVPVVIGAVASVWFSMNVRRVFGSELANQVLSEMRAVVEADRQAHHGDDGPATTTTPSS